MSVSPPRVVISYSHDSEAHADRVLALADRLRADGIDAMIDLYTPAPPQGWPAWCEEQIRQGAFVLIVCTETYLRRFNLEEQPGVGLGVAWEGRLIKQLLYNAASVSSKFAPVLFADGLDAHVPVPLAGATIHRIETPQGYEGLLRLLTDQPLTPMPPLGRRPELPPRQRQTFNAPPANHAPDKPVAGESRAGQPPISALSLPHPRVEDLFVGRRTERESLAAAVFPATGTRRPVVVSGMAGVGKSYLVDRFYWENMARFPGGYVRLALDPDNPASAAELLATLRDRLKLPASDDVGLALRLSTPLTLVHIENADSFDAGRVVGDLAATLPGCALVVSARLRDLGFSAGFSSLSRLVSSLGLRSYASSFCASANDAHGALASLRGRRRAAS